MTEACSGCVGITHFHTCGDPTKGPQVDRDPAQGAGKDDLTAADPGTITRNLRGLASRMEYRVEAIEQRDGKGAGAIQGRGIGIGYLLAKDLANALTEAATYIEGLRAVKPSELTEGHSASPVEDCSDQARNDRLFELDQPYDAETTDGWNPISTAPKDGPAFLVWVPENKCIYEVIARDSNLSIFGGGFRDNLWRATHWMPLPTPPSHPSTMSSSPSDDQGDAA